MSDSNVIPLHPARKTSAPAPETGRVLAAFAHALNRLPARPPGFTSCVAHLQGDIYRLAANAFVVRGLQRFRDALFHSPGREVEMRSLWRESLAAACYARQLATLLGTDAPLLTGAALLHRLGDVLALRALAYAEFCAGQRVQGPVLLEITAAQNGPLATQAIAHWALHDELGALLLGWRSTPLEAASMPLRQMVLAQLLALEHLHAGRATPGVLEAAIEEAHLAPALLDELRSAAPAIDALLLRAAAPMGPVAAG